MTEKYFGTFRINHLIEGGHLREGHLLFPEVEVNTYSGIYSSKPQSEQYFSLGTDTEGNNYCFSIKPTSE